MVTRFEQERVNLQGFKINATNGVGLGEKESAEMLKSLIQEPSTDEKREFLREWALQKAGGDSAHLPVIREARAALLERFGVGLGTDIVTKILRDLRTELNRTGTRRPPGTVSPITNVGPADHLATINHLVEVMLQSGVERLTITADGEIQELKRFARA